MLSSNIHKSEIVNKLPPKDLQEECNGLRRENLKLQEELLLRSSEVYQLILRTAKVNYRMRQKMQSGGQRLELKKGNSMKSIFFVIC